MVTGQAAAFERERQQHQALLARLVQRAEKAEVEAGQARSEATALKQSERSKGSAAATGADALVNASKVRSLLITVLWLLGCLFATSEVPYDRYHVRTAKSRIQCLFLD